MNTIDTITLETPDVPAAEAFYTRAFDLGDRLRIQPSDAATSGFRGFTLSLVVAQPADAVLLIDDAIAAGATVLKPAAKSLWGFGGVLQAPDGAIWTIATSSKKDTADPSRAIESLVLLLGSEDVKAAKGFYVDRGIAVAKSMGGYVEFRTEGRIGLGLYKRVALAKTAGVSAEGSGSHRIRISGCLGEATDPDGFRWSDES